MAVLAVLATFSTATFAQDNQCKVVIQGNDAMQFDIKDFTIDKAACPEFTVELVHSGSLPVSAMGHNVVITSAADMDGVAADGIGAGLDNKYVKPDDARVIAHSDVIGGGETTSITFSTVGLTAGEAYKFMCTFPGHYTMMNGDITVK